ncbi:hypothetical protein F5Y00DRAFT_225177 [Daldinia vernicosa]|uniref:uncharacterized protein n=1 Tax=Daldinia vernicosa TaxID=114800 RepID=UPI0020079ABC|nr:uncharacterized protein F5Y00DRAFT_225177 [Daldinia vernicosa]KAI0853026.1 hypothetical protein F5Y00DRAFT_225177 [Daldinia vernicosa]
MPDPIQRSACDRCHGQKLRCMRSASGGACIRCTRAKAACTWSPSLRSKKGLKPEAMNGLYDDRNNSVNREDNLDPVKINGNSLPRSTPAVAGPICQLSLPDMNFSLGNDLFQCDSALWQTPLITGSTSSSSPTLVTSTSPSLSQIPSQDASNTWQDRFNQEWAMLSAEQQSPPKNDSPAEKQGPLRDNMRGPPCLPLDIIQSLSDLNVETFSLSSAIPKPPVSTSQPLSWKDKDFAIDRTFQLSQRFIEVLDKLYPRQLGSSAQDPIISPIRESSTSRLASFDHASFLLVLSCYQRLIGIYNDIFGNMQACLDRSSVTAPEDYVRMPDVKVGSFSLPNSSALQITLVLQLARHLLQRMSFIIKILNPSPITDDNDTNDLMAPTFKAVTARETDLIERINLLRSTLVSLDIL